MGNSEAEQSVASGDPLEPVATTDIDFGKLPTPSGVARPHSPSATKTVPDSYQVHSEVQAEQDDRRLGEDYLESVLATDPEIQSTELCGSLTQDDAIHNASENILPEATAEEADGVHSVIAGSISVEEPVLEDPASGQSAASDGLEVATHHGDTPTATDYHIVEEITGEESNITHGGSPQSDGLDIATEPEETEAETMVFHVEEAVTEGRRIEVSFYLNKFGHSELIILLRNQLLLMRVIPLSRRSRCTQVRSRNGSQMHFLLQ